MFNFEELKSAVSLRPNTRLSSGQVVRELTNEDVKNAFLGESMEYMAKRELREEPSPAQEVTFKLTQDAYNTCSTAEELGSFIQGKIMGIAEKLTEANSKGSDVGIANAQSAALGLAVFIKNIQAKVGRSSFYRHLAALNAEMAPADARELKWRDEDYDGFKRVSITPDQIEDVVDELYDELTTAYGYALGLCSDNIAQLIGGFPFASIRNDDGKYDEYFSRVELYKALTDVREAKQATSAGATSLV